MHGPLGSRFVAVFPGRVTKHAYQDGGVRQPQYGVGVRSDLTFTSGKGTPPTLNVEIETLTNVVPAHRLRAFLRSYLPSTDGGRIIMWHGHTAALEIVRGCNPSGQCDGVVGTLAVIDGAKLFDVWTSQANDATAKAALGTFYLIRG